MHLFASKASQYRNYFALAVAVCLALPCPSSFAAEARGTVLTTSGSAPPRGNGVISQIELAVLCEDGSAVFEASLQNNGLAGGSGLFFANETALGVVALSGDAVPDLNGFLGSDLGDFRVDAGTNVAFSILLDRTLNPLDATAIYTGSRSTNRITQVARGNQEVSAEARLYSVWPPFMSMNAGGQIAFVAKLATLKDAIFRTDGTNLVEIVRVDGTGPAGEVFRGVSGASGGLGLNRSGSVLFLGDTVIQVPSLAFHKGFYAGDGQTLKRIVQNNDEVPGGGRFDLTFSIVDPAFNDAGQFAFRAGITGLEAGRSDNAGVFRGDGSSVVKIARKTELIPGGDGRFLDFGSHIELTEAGAALFMGFLTGTSDGATQGLFVGDGTNVTMIARTGQPAPGGGRFAQFDPNASTVSSDDGRFAINSSGQIVFLATIDLEDGGSPLDRNGLFFHDPAKGVLAVVRDGDQLGELGSVSSIEFAAAVGVTGRERSGLNQRGQVLYTCLAGSKAAVVRWEMEGEISFSLEVSIEGGATPMFAISWPATITDGVLQTTSAIGNQENWVGAGVTAELVGSRFRALVPATDRTRIFRVLRAQ